MKTFKTISVNVAVLSLLKGAALPVSDLEDSVHRVFGGLYEEDELIGVVGVELHPPEGLLRSLAVAQCHRGLGYGSVLVRHAEQLATNAGITELFLMTTTAAALFERCGYRCLPRAGAPESIRKSQQFAGLCPGTAEFMMKHL